MSKSLTLMFCNKFSTLPLEHLRGRKRTTIFGCHTKPIDGNCLYTLQSKTNQRRLASVLLSATSTYALPSESKKQHVQMLPPPGNNMGFDIVPASPSPSESSDESPVRRPIPPVALRPVANEALEYATLDEVDHFCYFLGHRLRALNTRTCFQLQIKMLQLIYDSEFHEL